MLIALSAAGHPMIRPMTIKPDAKLLRDYVGVYEIHALDVELVADFGSKKMYHYITQKDDTLFIQTTDGNKTPLTAIAKDTFIQLMSSDTGSFFYRTYHFTRDPNGKVNSMTVEAPLNMFMNRTEPKVDVL